MGRGPPPWYVAQRVERYLPGIYQSIYSDAEVLRQRFGVYLTSWYRTREENQRAGGARHSQHLIGLAIDVVPPRSQWGAVASWMRRAHWQVLDEGNHLHGQVFRPSGELTRFVDWAAS